ncbi:uncharacterized protein LOC135473977 [Liolophura sinensis]|uniref:uncharacterized protein LOC135473977 n=1 Tax=Liolophura sinensis TaxID=3198878 RepID=UPI003158B9C2
MSESGSVISEPEQFDYMGKDLDERRVDPCDENLLELKDANEKWEDIAISEPSGVDNEDSVHTISLKRSPEDPCLAQKITPVVQKRLTPTSFVERVQNMSLHKPPQRKTDDLPPLAIPGVRVIEPESDRPAGHPASLRERLKNASHQVKLGRLKQAGQSSERPKTYLEVPPTQEHFLEGSSHPSLTKRCHPEDDIGLNDEDIPAFGRKDAVPERNEGYVRRALRAVVGAVRCLVACTSDCVWRCFGGDPGPDEPIGFLSNNEPKLEFSGLLEEEEKQDSRPDETPESSDTPCACETTM